MDDNKTIFRVQKNKNNPYVMMDRRTLENNNLSWKAKGLLAYMLSRPDDWSFNMAHLIKQSTDGAASTKTAMKELRDIGYVVLVKERNESRQFTTFIYTVYEQPLSGKPLMEKPLVENHPVNNKELTNKELTNKKIYISSENIKILFDVYGMIAEPNLGSLALMINRRAMDELIKKIEKHGIDKVETVFKYYANTSCDFRRAVGGVNNNIDNWNFEDKKAEKLKQEYTLQFD